MPKPPPKSDPPRPPARPSANVLLGYRLLKLIAFVAGLPAATLCLMSLVGAITDNGWARVLGALVLVIGAPLFVADRLLPENDPAGARGLVSDVCAVTWMLITFVYAALLGPTTRGMMVREGDRLVGAGHVEIAEAAYFLASVKPNLGAATPAPAGSGSTATSASAGGSASAPLTSASAPPPASASAPPASSAKKGEKTPAELFKDLGPSVVTVMVKGKRGEGGGTGFLVDRDGIIATNHHVIEDAEHVRIKFLNGAVFEDLDLLDDEPAVDLALLKVNLSAPLDGGPHVEAGPLTLGDSEAIVVGEHAVSIGNPLGLEHTLTDGLVSSRRIYENRPWIQFSAPISPGNSGGPLFNMRGEVIGITTATLSAHGIAQNLNLAIPVNELKKLFKTSYPGRRRIGDGNAPSRW